jgi:hypothetical protein
MDTREKQQRVLGIVDRAGYDSTASKKTLLYCLEMPTKDWENAGDDGLGWVRWDGVDVWQME